MSDDLVTEWREEKLAELNFLRACIHAWAGGDMPGTEAMQNFRELAAELRAHQHGYHKWRLQPFPRSTQVFKWTWPDEPKR